MIYSPNGQSGKGLSASRWSSGLVELGRSGRFETVSEAVEAVKEQLAEIFFPFLYVSLLFPATSSSGSHASFAHCFSRTISDGVNIRGAGEVPSFRLSKAIEGVSEESFPPLLEVFAVFLSEFMNLLPGRAESFKIEPSCQ